MEHHRDLERGDNESKLQFSSPSAASGQHAGFFIGSEWQYLPRPSQRPWCFSPPSHLSTRRGIPLDCRARAQELELEGMDGAWRMGMESNEALSRDQLQPLQARMVTLNIQSRTAPSHTGLKISSTSR